MADIELSKALHERVYERIRDSIGDLMTDDDLKKLVDAAAKKAFFEPRYKTNNYGSKTEIQPEFVAMVEDLLRAEVSKQVTAWMNENSAIVEKTIAEIVQQGIGRAVMAAMDQKFNWAMSNLQSNIVQSLASR